MKRFTLAGTFALLGGLATLLLLTSIVYSCRMGSTPHQTPYNSGSEEESTHGASSSAAVTEPLPSQEEIGFQSPAARKLTISPA